MIEKFVFGRSRLNSSVFEKLLILYSCISFIKLCALRNFYIKMLCFSKIWFFQIFDWSNLSLDRLKLKNFQFLSFWPNFFFHASFMFRIHMQCIVFCIHLLVLQSYLSLFSQITCIHFAKLNTQLDLKIDWLIFELCTF